MSRVAEGTAARVLDVAESLIQQRGYAGFSFDDVAQVVGLRKPSVHHHFRTKGDFLAAVAPRSPDPPLRLRTQRRVCPAAR